MTSAIAPGELIAANEAAATYYRQMLLGPEGDGPRTYLSSRGFSTLLQETPWTVGYAPPGWTKALDHLRAQGFDNNTLVEAGIASMTRRGSLIDRFRDRLLFGIRDPAGRLVAFLGRAAPNARQDSPKYLGCPGTSIYRKGEVIFGLREQQDRVEARRPLVIAEGPFDAIAVSEATDSVGLALCGTAMTPTQAGLVANSASDVVLCLDSDPAGRTATVRSSALLWERRLIVEVAQPPAHDDPASLTRDALAGIVHAAGPAERTVVKVLLEDRPELKDNVEAQLAGLRYVARALAAAPPPREAIAADELSRQTRLGYEVVTTHLAEAISHRSGEVRRVWKSGGILQLPG